MGHQTHHAIIITSCHMELIRKARKKAKELLMSFSNTIVSEVNVEYSFFIGTDGSKDGWEESNNGDKQRKEFMDWCDSQAYSDGSNSLIVVELFYHTENNKTGIVQHTGNKY